MKRSSWFKFDAVDWMASTIRLSPASRGILISLLSEMHLSKERGKLTYSISDFSRILGCSEEEIKTSFSEFKRYGSVTVVTDRNGKVTDRNKKVTLINEPMYKEFLSYNSNALRQRKHREKLKSNAHVDQKVTQEKEKEKAPPFPPSSLPLHPISSPPIVPLKEKKEKEAPYNPSKGYVCVYSFEFEVLWKAHPGKGGKEKAFRAWEKAKNKITLPELLASVEKQKNFDKWRRGIIPELSTWLNQERWDEVEKEVPDSARGAPLQGVSGIDLWLERRQRMEAEEKRKNAVG